MSNPVRMCIVCRERFLQTQLVRLQYKESKLIYFSGEGRSFYLCLKCKDVPRLCDCVIRVCKLDKKNKENIKSALKEIFLYG